MLILIRMTHFCFDGIFRAFQSNSLFKQYYANADYRGRLI